MYPTVTRVINRGAAAVFGLNLGAVAVFIAAGVFDAAVAVTASLICAITVVAFALTTPWHRVAVPTNAPAARDFTPAELDRLGNPDPTGLAVYTAIEQTGWAGLTRLQLANRLGAINASMADALDRLGAAGAIGVTATGGVRRYFARLYRSNALDLTVYAIISRAGEAGIPGDAIRVELRCRRMDNVNVVEYVQAIGRLINLGVARVETTGGGKARYYPTGRQLVIAAKHLPVGADFELRKAIEAAVLARIELGGQHGATRAMVHDWMAVAVTAPPHVDLGEATDRALRRLALDSRIFQDGDLESAYCAVPVTATATNRLDADHG